MRVIEFEARSPTDTDVPGWTPWSEDKWDDWRAKSEQLVQELGRLDKAGKKKERNKLIDDNREHWSELKPWLSAISFGKCWFTEARDKASHLDVEHFRPKKVAKDLDGSERDGYWWLAFDVSNLRLAGNVPNRKKGGWFPLHRESPCSCFDCRCEESEEHYLLDPIKQSDVDLLAFDDTGHAIPCPGTTDAWALKRVKVSVERLKLNDHDALPQERRKVWQKVTRAIRAYQKAKRRYRPVVNPTPKEKMEENARVIREMTRPEAEFSAVARWCVLMQGDPQLSRLIS